MNDRKTLLTAENAVCLILAVVICVFNIRTIGDSSHPIIFADEAGYWNHAAIMAGCDWTGVSDPLVWYSYGYSFLLTILIRLFPDTVMLYQAALVLNTVMIVGVYAIYIRILRELFPEISRYAVYFAACAAALYTPYQVQTGVAWSETLILLMMVLITYTIMHMVKHPTYLNAGALGLLSAYIYMVHNRCIGVMASVILIVCLGAMLQRIRFRHMLTFLGTLLTGLLADRMIRPWLEGITWMNERPSGNDMGSTLEKLQYAFTSVKGFKTLLSLLAAQSFASFVSAMGLSLIGLWFMLRFVVPRLAAILKARKENEQWQKLVDTKFFIYSFTLCSFCVSVFITSVFMIWYDTIDQVVYTRYFDMTAGLLIAIGICKTVEAVSDHKRIICIAMTASLFLIGAGCAASLADSRQLDVYNRIASPSAAWMYQHFENNFFQYAMLILALLGMLLAGVVFLKKRRNLCICFVSVCSIGFSCITSVSGREHILMAQQSMADDAALFRRMERTGELYILENCGSAIWLGQYALMDTPLTGIPTIQEAPADAIVIANAADLIVLSEYTILDNSGAYLALSANPDTEDAYRTIPLSLMHTLMDENYLCYGPYCYLPKGSYIFELILSAERIPADVIGYAEISSTSTGICYDRTELMPELFEQNKTASVRLTPVMDADVSDIEIRVCLFDPVQTVMRLDSISYKRNS